MASLTCPHIRGTRSLLEVRLSLENSWSGACSEDLCQSPDFLVGTCLEISQLLAQSSPLLTTCLLPRETGGSALGTTHRAPHGSSERCSSGPNGMTRFARGPTLSSTSSLLSLPSMWYIPLLMDPVSSASSQKTPSIPLCTNVLTSSHRLLLSWSRLQLFNFAVGFHLRHQRQQSAIHQLGLVIQLGHRSRAVAAVQAQRGTNGTISRFDLGLSWLEAQELKTPRCARCLERNTRDFRSASGSPYLHVLGDQARQCVCFIQTTSLPRDSWRVSPLYKPCAA